MADLFDVVVARKLSGGGGGGGSSDFSTAEVTVVNTMSSSAESTKLSVPTINPPSTLISSTFISMPEDTDNISVVLYKDGTLIDISEFDASTEFAVSGDAELLSRPVKGIRIFGDCTITISGGK